MIKDPTGPRPVKPSSSAATQLLAVAETKKIWAIQQKHNPDKGGPEFWVVNPETAATFPSLSNFCAFAVTENDAHTIAAALNHSVSAWRVIWNHPEATKAGDSLYSVLAPGEPLPSDVRLIAGAESENDARRIRQALHGGNEALPVPDEGPEQPWNELGGASHRYSFIEHYIKKLAGRILTILDAAFINEQQNKAVKRLVKNEIRAGLTLLWKKSFTDNYHYEEDGSPEPDPLND